MKVLVIYGTERKECTYHIAQEVVQNIENVQVDEVFLPRDFSQVCISCMRCFTGEYGACIHKEYKEPILHKMEAADFIILTSPVYGFHLTGQVKCLLDHFAYMWMVHRPNEKMFGKQGMVIAASCGPVYRKALNELKDNLDFWGVAHTYKLGAAVFHTDWEQIKPCLKEKIRQKARRTAAKVQKRAGRVRPSLRVRWWFFISKMMQKYQGANPVDVQYWEQQGWLRNAVPWRQYAGND